MILSPDQEQALARRSRMVAVVVTVALLLWLGVWWVGGQHGTSPKFVFLTNMATLAAFFWTMIVTYQIWRTRRDSRG